jgi:hypothetical protein
MSANRWRRVRTFTRSVGRLLDRPLNYLRQERQVKYHKDLLSKICPLRWQMIEGLTIRQVRDEYPT